MRASQGWGLIAAALAAAILCGFGRPAAAFGRRQPAYDGRGAPAPLVARYAIDEGGDFILDREDRQALVRFSDSPEIWVLWPFRGPRGDIIYKNDVDEPMLRATKLGGMTVFTTRRPEGAAAALIGPGPPIRLSPLGPFLLAQRVSQASLHVSRAAQHLIGFVIPDADAESDGLIADTAQTVVEAMTNLAYRPGGHKILARLGSISISQGAHMAVALRGRVVAITINPSLGLAGRPSSERILQALGARPPDPGRF